VPTMFVRMLEATDEVAGLRYDVSSLKRCDPSAGALSRGRQGPHDRTGGADPDRVLRGSEGNGVTVSTSPEWLAHRGSVAGGGRQDQDSRRER